MEGGGRSLVAKKGLDSHGGKTCYDQMVFLVCPASQGVSKKVYFGTLRRGSYLQGFLLFDPGNVVPN